MGSLNNENCIHSRKIPALIDIDVDDEKYSSLVNHISNCQVCSDLYKKSLDNMDNLTEMIPKVNIPRELQMKFESQTGNFLKKSFPEVPDRQTKIIHNSSLAIGDLLKAAVSKQFLIGSSITVVIFGLIHFFTNK